MTPAWVAAAQSACARCQRQRSAGSCCASAAGRRPCGHASCKQQKRQARSGEAGGCCRTAGRQRWRQRRPAHPGASGPAALLPPQLLEETDLCARFKGWSMSEQRGCGRVVVNCQWRTCSVWQALGRTASLSAQAGLSRRCSASKYIISELVAGSYARAPSCRAFRDRMQTIVWRRRYWSVKQHRCGLMHVY